VQRKEDGADNRGDDAKGKDRARDDAGQIGVVDQDRGSGLGDWALPQAALLLCDFVDDVGQGGELFVDERVERGARVGLGLGGGRGEGWVGGGA
jgi:hypothetical protein